MGTFQSGFTFKKGVLTNGAPLPGEDFISGLVFFNTAPPSLWPTGLIKQCFSPQDAINCGIDGLSADETPAKAIYLLTAVGAAGDIISIYSQEPINPLTTGANPNRVLLCTYTVTSS